MKFKKEFFKTMVFVLYVSALIGCAAPAKITREQLLNADYGIYPDNYEQLVKDYFNRILKDPYSAQYRIFKPYQGYLRKTPPIAGGGVETFGYIVNVYVNAKNSYGGYVGEKSYRIFIKNGSVVDEIMPNPWYSEPWYQ